MDVPTECAAAEEAEAEADSTNDAVINPAIDPGMGEPVKDEMMM